MSQTIREEGFSKDTDKLVRRLSLVALLLSRRGQPVSAAEIQRRVEGYPTMTEDAFKRRFYEDRSELAGLGVAIVAEPADAGPELYSLPADAYYLPAVELSGEELTALAACLAVLERRFAYSQPLRLALLSLAQGRPELITEAELPPLTVVPETEAPAAMLPKLQAAIAERKTVCFSYYAISHDEELERTVDPYGLQLVGGEWYLIGWCHLREARRTFRLSRIRSRVTHATRAPHDFPTPKDFDIGAYRDRPAWLLARPQGTARIHVAASMAWWIEAHWAHCGAIVRQDDGAIVYQTEYADARPLLSWLLGLGDAAEILEPAELRERLAGQLRHLEGLLDDEPPAAAAVAVRAAPASSRRRRRPTADWRVEVDRFTRLTALTTYLLQSCGEDEAVLDIAAARADLGVSAEELRADVRLLNLVNFGADGTLLYAEYNKPRGKISVSCDPAGPAFSRPARLSPLQADTLLLAIELVGGQLPTTSGGALASAADKLRAARWDASPALVSSDLLVPADGVLDAVNAAIVGPPPARDRVLDGGHRRRSAGAHGRAVPPRPQPRRVVLRLLVPHRRRDARVPRRHDQVGAASGRALRAAPRGGARTVPARGHPRLGKLRSPDGDRLVQPGRAPLGRGAPAGAGAGGRVVPCRAAVPGRTLALPPSSAVRR